MERHFERDLEDLKGKLITMGGLVDAQLGSACGALFEGDLARAREVIEKDREIDAFDTMIDRLCMDIFALTQPVAVDLRLLMSALAINSSIAICGVLPTPGVPKVNLPGCCFALAIKSPIFSMPDFALVRITFGDAPR